MTLGKKACGMRNPRSLRSIINRKKYAEVIQIRVQSH